MDVKLAAYFLAVLLVLTAEMMITFQNYQFPSYGGPRLIFFSFQRKKTISRKYGVFVRFAQDKRIKVQSDMK